MKIIEAIPGQGVLPTLSPRPEVVTLRKQFAQHDKLTSMIPGFRPDALFPLSHAIFAGAAISSAITREQAYELTTTRADIVREAENRKPPEERSAMGIFIASRAMVTDFLSKFPSLDWTNDNGPGAHILGGPIKELKELADQAGKRFKGYLSAEGIYHSEDRREEAERFREILMNVDMKDPIIPIIPSTGPKREITTAEGIKEEMVGGMIRKVYLEEVVNHWRQLGYDTVIDISSGATIQQLVSRMNVGFQFVTVEEGVEKMKDFLTKLKDQLPKTNFSLT